MNIIHFKYIFLNYFIFINAATIIAYLWHIIFIYLYNTFKSNLCSIQLQFGPNPGIFQNCINLQFCNVHNKYNLGFM